MWVTLSENSHHEIPLPESNAKEIESNKPSEASIDWSKSGKEDAIEDYNPPSREFFSKGKN